MGVTSHNVHFDVTKVISNIEHVTRVILRKAIETGKQPNNLKIRSDTQGLPTTWKPVLRRTKNRILRSTTTAIMGPITSQVCNQPSGIDTAILSLSRNPNLYTKYTDNIHY